MSKPTLIVVDDDLLICEDIAELLRDRFEVLAKCRSGRAALTQMEQQPAQLVVTDISMPGMDGVALIREIRQRWPDTVMIVLSNYDDFHYVKEAMRLGASEYLLKEDVGEDVFASKVLEIYRQALGLDAVPEETPARTVRAEIQNVLNHLHVHFAETILLDELAALAGFSRNHFCKLFREETGYSCVDYIQHLRIDRARELLRKGNIKTYEVAERVGFRDYRYFCRIFKELTGQTPSECKHPSQREEDAP